MKIPTFPYCCCCIDLRTGGLIIGWMKTVGAFISIVAAAVNSNPIIAAAAVSFIISIAWLYGIYKVKPAFLLAIIAVDLITLTSLVTLPIILLIFTLSQGQQLVENFALFALIVYVIAVIVLNIFILHYSIYRRIIKIKLEMMNDQNIPSA